MKTTLPTAIIFEESSESERGSICSQEITKCPIEELFCENVFRAD